VSIPVPRPGLVVNYSYLWHSEERLGEKEGKKNRPCSIVLMTSEESGKFIVLTAAITHVPPKNPDDAVEIPLTVKQQLGLDMDRS
jgi:hypothetical protein